MSLDACAGLLQRGDPDRYLAVMAAPVPARALLLPLYAFNLEVARAPWVTEQPLIARMRLQFWHDVLDDPQPRAHEVAGPLRQVISSSGLDTSILHRMIDARLWDVERAPHADGQALATYVEATAAGLMRAAGAVLAAPGQADPGLRALGWASGLAAYLRAVPQMQARGRSPLPQEAPDAIAALAEEGLVRLATARQARKRLGAAALAAWQAAPILALAAREPQRVLDGRLSLSEFSRRRRLLWMATTGRF